MDVPGYATAGLLEPFSAGLGFQDWLPITAPGAGNNATFLVPGEFSLRILSAMATLTTDANAANRVLSIDYISPRVGTFCRNPSIAVQIANVSNQAYIWSATRAAGDAGANLPTQLPILSAFLPSSTTVQFTVDNKQVGDTLTGLLLFVEKFETGPAGYPLGRTAIDE